VSYPQKLWAILWEKGLAYDGIFTFPHVPKQAARNGLILRLFSLGGTTLPLQSRKSILGQVCGLGVAVWSASLSRSFPGHFGNPQISPR
jgi:hypothetical protein